MIPMLQAGCDPFVALSLCPAPEKCLAETCLSETGKTNLAVQCGVASEMCASHHRLFLWSWRNGPASEESVYSRYNVSQPCRDIMTNIKARQQTHETLIRIDQPQNICKYIYVSIHSYVPIGCPLCAVFIQLNIDSAWEVHFDLPLILPVLSMASSKNLGKTLCWNNPTSWTD